MPVGTIQHPSRQSVRTAVTAAPPRLRPKGPVGPDFYRQNPTAAGRPKQSAVERLEADKAKYVKSQVALSKQQPVRPPELRQPLLSPNATLKPSKKMPAQPKTKQEPIQLDLEHLSNLISDVSDGPNAAANVESTDTRDSEVVPTVMTQQKKERMDMPSHPDCSSPVKVRLKAAGSARAESITSPTAGTVRRVDVIPQATHVQTPRRPPLFIRQPLQPLPLHPQFPLRPVTSHLYLRTKNMPLKPVVAVLPKPDNLPASLLPVSSPLCIPVFSPPSPAVTLLSSSSTRKRPSLTRSKSDMSDRFSRAGTELERFFNLCGLDPADLQELTGSTSDIVSMARFRSVSAPGSECAGSGRQVDGGDEEEQDNAEERVPYGVSVIERNARVIKWLYGVRQAK
ncbi:protein FAM110A [Dunckerocampus dactyliophorus]|uniref:protein FAM110A n=1 Tax=Dunckerocampus dactyliophorus TaxID=161453 RepID=UPI00240708E9|nr:protein FAM110A [Dunckerocampus dactyliophorus]